MKKLEDYVRSIPDFPEKGIIFRDLTSVLQDADGLHLAIDEMQKRLDGLDFDVIAGTESRGFILGMPLAYNLHKPFVLIRKEGKLPCETVKKEYDLEYGTAVIEMHKDAIKPGQRVVLVDDLIATGGTSDIPVAEEAALTAEVLVTADEVQRQYPVLDSYLPRDIAFTTTYALEEKYPMLTLKERENVAAKEYGAVFLMEIGDRLKNGEKHDGRAPDYDDWHLNGDILVYNRVTDAAFELSSMGIRVDADSLVRQLTAENMLERLELPFHKALAAGELPLSIGGGIGQSRLCMLLLQKAHIGEVHASLWPESELVRCRKMGVELL